MTVQNTNTKNIYVGNGSTTVFPFTFYTFPERPEFIKVYITGADGVDVLTDNYTIDMQAQNVTYPKSGSPLPQDTKITIARELPLLQDLNLVNQGPFFAEEIEKAFDKALMIAQQLSEATQRALAMAISTDAESFDNKIPLVAGKSIKVNEDGNGFEVTEDPAKVLPLAESAVETAIENANIAINNASSALTSKEEAEKYAKEVISKIRAYSNIAEMVADENIKAGQTAKTLGYYFANDGGGGTYLVREKTTNDVVDGGSIHELQNGLVAELIIENGIVNVKQFGAKGDGVTDDTQAFKNALEVGNVIFDESTYYVTETIYVDVGKRWLRGLSSRSVIFGKTGEDTPVLFFYSSQGDYYTRHQRENIIGEFTVKPWGDNYGNGIQIGGLTGTEYEGAVECSVYRNIRIDNCNKALVLGAHLYKTIFENVDVNDSNYSIYSVDNYDCGEVTTFINCGFWAGSIYSKHPAYYYACTIHLLPQQTVGDVVCSHYLSKDHVFNGCHFEAIVRQQTTIANVFYVEGGLCRFTDCDGVVSGDITPLRLNITGYLFLEEAATLNPHGVFINGGDWKYLLTRLIFTTPSLTNGRVKFKNFVYQQDWDGLNIQGKLYSYSDNFKVGRSGKLDIETITNSTGYSVTNIEDGVLLNATSEKYWENTKFNFYRKKDVGDCGLVNIHGEITSDVAVNCQLSYNANTETSCLIFTDENDNQIAWDVDGENKNIFMTSSDNLLSVDLTITVPARAKYCYYGLGGYFKQEVANVTCKMCYEFV